MDKLKLDIVGGMPLKLDDLLWQNGDLDAVNWGLVDGIQSQLLTYGTDYIVEGCTYAAPNITAGWIMLDSELMRVDAHAGTDDFFVKTITFDARGLKTFKNTTVNNTYEKNRGVLSGASGSLNITTALRLEDKIIQLLATSTQQLAVANIPNLPASKTTSGTFAAARIPLATESAVGGRELATQAETDTGTNDITILTPLKLRNSSQFGGLLTKSFDIGDWDMDANTSVSIVHGLPDDIKIRTIQVLIRRDGGGSSRGRDFISPDVLTAPSVQGSIQTNITTIRLDRLPGGFFDSIDYDSTSYNRGWITIQYIP